MVHASLFTGIGGFDLAAEWMGWTNSFQCEIDPFCQKVLAKNFPDADRHTDIKQFDARRYRGTVDVLSGGFPCQPASYAGKRKGQADDRWLWPDTMRVIDEVQPPWFVGENVAGLITLGLDTVLFDLEAAGYDVETFLLPACGVGAPHQRERLWIVAHSAGAGFEKRLQTGFGGIPEAIAAPQKPEPARVLAAQGWAQFPTESPVYRRDDGLSEGLVRVTNRGKQIKSHGNSIVPQVAYEIFQALEAADAAPQP